MVGKASFQADSDDEVPIYLSMSIFTRTDGARWHIQSREGKFCHLSRNLWKERKPQAGSTDREFNDSLQLDILFVRILSALIFVSSTFQIVTTLDLTICTACQETGVCVT